MVRGAVSSIARGGPPFSPGMLRIWLAACLLTCLSGCLYKVLEIRSDPPDARVYLDGKEVGQTPLDFPFTHYGDRRLVVAKSGYRPVAEQVAVKAPWWAWPPFDFFVELKVEQISKFRGSCPAAGFPGERQFSSLRSRPG